MKWTRFDISPWTIFCYFTCGGINLGAAACKIQLHERLLYPHPPTHQSFCNKVSCLRSIFLNIFVFVAHAQIIFCTKSATPEVEGDIRCKSGKWQQEVVRVRNLIKVIKVHQAFTFTFTHYLLLVAWNTTKHTAGILLYTNMLSRYTCSGLNRACLK